MFVVETSYVVIPCVRFEKIEMYQNMEQDTQLCLVPIYNPFALLFSGSSLLPSSFSCSEMHQLLVFVPLIWKDR